MCFRAYSMSFLLFMTFLFQVVFVIWYMVVLCDDLEHSRECVRYNNGIGGVCFHNTKFHEIS